MTAGLGTRLDPLTRIVAKAAVPLGDRTLVERVLDWLRREGIRDAVLNLHHLPHTITRVVGDGAHLGLRVRYSWEDPVLGSAGGPRRALPLLDADTFFIVNGDTLCDFSLAEMLEAHRASGADVTVALVPNPAPDRYNGIVLDDDGRVTGWLPKGRAQGSWHFIGVQVAQSSAFAHLTDGVPVESVTGIYQDLLIRSGRLRGFRPTTPFLDVGTPRDYLRAAMSLQDAPAGRGANVVWAGAVVDAGAQIANCIVAGDLRLAAGFAARDAVIVPAAIARPDDAVERRNGVAVFPMGP
jgi:NDP-sugar pyrophosphorylase family protein